MIYSGNTSTFGKDTVSPREKELYAKMEFTIDRRQSNE